MAKTRTVFSCQACGRQEPKWMGRCSGCEEWGTLVEEVASTSAAAHAGLIPGGAQARRIAEISVDEQARAHTGLAELDRVLGGGVVAGSAILVGGAPGIGKSTLLLQAAAGLVRPSGSSGELPRTPCRPSGSSGELPRTPCRPSGRGSGGTADPGGKALYVSAEESEKQVKLRADRIGVGVEELYVLAEVSLDAIFATLEKLKPVVAVVDSIQTVFSSGLESAPGSVSQVREVAGRLTAFAKRTGTAMFLVGHVTKEGAIAGPRVVEHLVDTVLYFEETSGHSYRMLRGVKNRFGSTNELGVFQMNDSGLAEVANPSELFLAERPTNASGSVVLAALEGTRPLLVEAQALVSRSSLGNPRRTALGIDPARASLLTAILEKKSGLALSDLDVYVNVAGGVRIREPAADLAIAMAIASSVFDRPVDSRTVVFGEIGLAGEIRAVTQAEARLKEAAKLGFARCVLPAASAKGLAVKGIEACGVRTVDEALQSAIQR